MTPRLTVRDAAAKLGISEVSVRKLVAERKIAHTRIGPSGVAIRFTDGDLEEYLAARHVPREERRPAPPASPPKDDDMNFGFGPVERRYTS